MRHNYINLNQIKSNPDGQPTVNRQSRLMSYRGYLKNLAMIFAVLTLSVANIGMAWGAVYKTYSLSDLTNTSLTYEKTGLSNDDQKLNKGERKVEVPCASASGTLYLSGTGAQDRYASIWGSNGTAVDANRRIAMTNGYGKGISFTSADILTEDGKYYIIFGNVDDADYKINAFKYTLSAACGGCSAPTSPSISGTTAYTEGQDISLTASATGTDGSTTYTWYKGADWATASAGSSIGSAATFTKASCAVGDAGTYWCNISNGTGCEVQVSKTITVAEASCDAADLTASNITSNGDQDAGTGITFSKEGSPASGDTWYWQTSATGTDKSSNASSPYTTATTVGSYTVYLRAYNTAGDCWGTAASMTNTIYPAPSAMIHNTFAVNDAWSSTIATQDKTNITSLNAMAAVGESVGSGSNKSGLTQKIPSQSSEDASKYMSLSFNVASGKQLNVTSVVFDEQPVSKKGTFKVSISDNQGSATKTQTIASGAAGSKHTLTLDGDDIVGSFKGTVTVKVWAYGWGDGYRFGDYFYINGTVTAAPSCTAPNHVDISGRWDRFGGETISLTAAAYASAGTGSPIADGDITGWQWEKLIGSTWTALSNGTVDGVTTSGATTANLQIANCKATNSGKYRCVVSTGATCSTASATATDGTEGFGVKVYVLECYTGGTTEHHFTRTGDSQAGTLTMNLTANTAYAFKVHADNTYYGNNGTINKDETNWVMCNSDNGGDCANNLTVNSGLGGTFTFGIEYSTSGNSSVEGEPEISVTYPRKTIYLNPGVWDTDGAKYAIYYFIDGHEAWSGLLVGDACGTYTTIPQWNGVTMIAVRLSSDATDGAWNKKWNQTGNIPVTNNDYVEITGWEENDCTYSTYTPATYSITFEGNGNTGGSMTNVTGITCGEDHTLAANGFARTGYTFAGWATTADGAVAHADKATISNITSNITLYAKWDVNSYTLTASATVSNPMTQDSKTGAITGNFTNNPVTEITSGTTTSTSSNTFTVNKGTPVTVTAAATIAGTAAQCDECTYVFDSWENIPASVTADVSTIHAIYKTTYSISFKETDETDVAGISASSYDYRVGKAASTLPTPTKSGYTFGGWYNENTLTTPAADIDDDAWGNITYYAKWTEEASLTAIEENTLYQPLNMLCTGMSPLPSGDTYFTDDAYSTDNRFYYDVSSGNGPKAHTISEVTLGSGQAYEATFTSEMWVKGTSTVTDGIPSAPSIKFLTPSTSGTLYLYIESSSCPVKFKKEDGTASNITGLTQVVSGKIYSTTVEANSVYYIYGNGGSNTGVYGLKLITCSTPDAPTAFSAGSITSTGATFSITDEGDAASYDIYYSESSTAPTVGTAATTTSTEKTKAVTGLTANTTYYAWVRSVCDADHKSAWFALGTTSFTTSAAEPDPLVHWTMKINQSSWGTTATATTDETNITSINTSRSGTTTNTSTDATVKVTMASAEVSDNSAPDNSANFTFTVNSAKKVVPEKVTCQVFNVSSGNRTYKAQISDNNGHVYNSTNTLAVSTEAKLTDATFNFASGGVLVGDVTLKIYAWKTSGSPTEFRMGADVKLFGTVDNFVCTALNLTRGGQENGTYTVGNYTGNPLTCTVNAGEPASYQWKQYTQGQGVGEAVNAVGSGSTTPSFTPNPVSANTYFYACEVTDICGNTLITPYTGTFVFNTAATYSVTHNLSNVTATSGATGASAATEGVAYDAVFAANTGYVLPSTITVTIGGSPATVGTGYTWNASTGAFQVPAEQVTGDIVITIAGETAPATKDIYYGQVAIADGALVREITNGTVQFFTNIGGTVANNTEISLSSTPSTGGIYYNSNNLTDAELSKSSNWSQGSGSNRYIRGLKFANGTTYTLALGTKVASAITFYGWCGSSSKTMTVGEEEFTSSSTKNTFAKHEFIKTGGFTDNVSITQDGDFYGILVITIQTATPCTTPVIPALSNQTLCAGADIAEWDATVTNAAAIEAAGETVAYSWKKKGNDTELANTASFDLGASAAESQAGTYVVTATVSKAGKASATATKEVTLTVNEATEVTAITADKATVYPTNSVTLTATANMDATWQWYTCTNAEGAGAAIISGAESASYTIASAGEAGTYYYKAVATGSCGTGSMVYTLTVSAAAGGDCFHFVSVLPAGDISVSSNTSLVTPTHATTLEGGTMKVGSQQITITKNGLKLESSKSVSITLDAALEAGNVVIVKGTTATAGCGVTINGVNFYEADSKTFDVSYTVVADDGLEGKTALTVTKYSGSSYLQEIKITGCGEACTDPEVTASADNTTACVGTSVTFTAANAHASATYQWQKYSGGAWTDIDDATAATYNIASVATTDAMKYRVIASHDCHRTSNEVTLSVPSAPNFGSTVPASVNVMQTIALSINTVEATDATKYRWYKSADNTWDAGDTEIGTNKELIKAYDGEATGSPSYYVFCRAQNSCGITTSTAIAVNVTAYVEEECATKGNEGEHEFGFENTDCSSDTYGDSKTPVWKTSSRSKYLTYTAPERKYFATAKVTVAHTGGTKCGYAYSTNGGTTWVVAELGGLSATLTAITIELPANVNAFRISRNLTAQDGEKGSDSGNFYFAEACFTYENACTATTVTPSTASVDYEMGDDWTDPTFTLSVAGTLSYSSSNEDIASVDDDGTVTFNGEAGTVTITASYTGGTISETEYCASSGSYTINVSCPDGAPKIVADGSTDMVDCNSSVTLHAKKQDSTAFADGTYQWFRNGTEIDGATSSSYTATQAGTYTVERTNTSDCTTPSTNSAIVTSETTEPEVERLVPFQYYHVNKTYSDQMKMRHLFAVKNSGTLDGKHFKMYVSRNGETANDVTSSDALVVVPNGDGHVDTVMVDLNKLSGKYSEGDELVFTCKAIDCSSNVSDVYKNTITMNVIGTTPTLALICSGTSKVGGTRKTGELTVGGDFLTGYNKADLCQQTGNTSFDANTEWGLYTRLNENYIVTPVNGYAVFNKLNYEPFDILLLTDYPKASKSDAAATVLDDMADLCDYRPMLSFKTHMVAKQPSKWAAKGFTTTAEVPKQSRLRLNITCYAHPMFDDIKGSDVARDYDDGSQIVYTMLSEPGYESSKGMQGFRLAAAENFVTIGLVHYNATATDDYEGSGKVKWTPESGDEMLVAAAERQENIEARMIFFSLNCGAQSKLTAQGETVVMECLEYLLNDATIEGNLSDCSLTFDNKAGDGNWNTPGNWGPDYVTVPGQYNAARIAAPATVDIPNAKALELRIMDGGSVTIPAGSGLEIKSTIRHLDGKTVIPTEVSDLHIGSSETGNGTLIFNNNTGDTKAQVDMYSKGFIDYTSNPEGEKNYQYIGTPFIKVNALYNYYGSWIYSWGIKKNGNWGWVAVKNGGPMTAWTGYCISQESPTYYETSGTMTATGTVDIAVPAGENMVVGNSWTAPIDINALTTDDLEGLVANIYFFNTGVDKEGTAGAAGSRYAGGTYVTVPVEAARYEGEDDHINSMQGFFVKNTSGSDGALHLDYDRHVRGTTRGSIIGDALHAPARRAALDSNEPEVLKIKVSGENYDDKLLLLAREDFSTGFDNGWDGDKWDGNESALYIYTTDSEGTENSVSAMPELEGTIIGFRAGEDDAYTLNFEYLNSDEPLYLYDVENNTYTQIMTGMTYRFFTTDNEKHARFIITRSNGQEVATGVELVSGSLDRSKAKKLLIENKMFIMVNGMLYDATGKVVK